MFQIIPESSKSQSFSAWMKIQPGKINLKPFEILVDVIFGLIIPEFTVSFKFLTYKSFNKAPISTLFKTTGSKIRDFLLKIGITVSLNVIFSVCVNNYFMMNITRVLTIGGIICLILDVLDGNIDYWFSYKEIKFVGVKV